MKEYKPYKEGKVRELYDLGDSLVMVCTDRISAFDKILDTDIPEKGAILNCMSRFWFDHTKDIVPNHRFPQIPQICRNFSVLHGTHAAA